MSVAARVAEEVEGTNVGYEAGYPILRTLQVTRPWLNTGTDCVLLCESLTDPDPDPDLASFSAIIIDGAHEQTLSTDILFASIKAFHSWRGQAGSHSAI